MSEPISITQARAELADLVSRVAYAGVRVTLTRNGKPLAALVPLADLERLAAGDEDGRGVRHIGTARLDFVPSGDVVDRSHEIAAEHRRNAAAEHRPPSGGPSGSSSW